MCIRDSHYIKITKGDWPKITEAKQILEDGAEYVGPYISSWAVKQSIDEALKIFRLPSCSRRFPQDIGRGRPCLNFYIKQCCAPCRGKITKEEYQEAVEDALAFLRGGDTASIRMLTEKMNEAADAMELDVYKRQRFYVKSNRARGGDGCYGKPDTGADGNQNCE